MNNEQIPESVIQELLKEVLHELRCLNALYIEVGASIADDVKHRVLEVVQSQYQKNKVLRDALEEAKLQIEYLHSKFTATGTGNAVLSKIEQH